MEPPIFYAPPKLISSDTIELPSQEMHHAKDVLRLRSGSLVMVVDGVGNGYRGELKIASDKKASVEILSQIRNFGEPTVRLTLVAGLSSGYKFDDVVDKGTQLGVMRFVPVITEKSKVKIDKTNRGMNKVNRFEKVALAAMKQCRRSYIPEISTPISFKEYMRQADSDSIKLMFHTSEKSQKLSHISWEGSSKRVTVLIGPEAGFSHEEEIIATENGFILVSLGRRILRTENAGPIACALVMEKLGELS
jgi:16S rRNA (uracil1498-N3)-methyltransferase